MPKRQFKALTCDGCGKERRGVQSCGRDANGASEAPVLCFLCRKEGERGWVYDRQAGRYVRTLVTMYDEISEAECRALGEEQVRDELEAQAIWESDLTNGAQ